MIVEVEGSVIVVNSNYDMGVGMGTEIAMHYPALEISRSCPMTKDEMCMLQVSQGMQCSTYGTVLPDTKVAQSWVI